MYWDVRQRSVTEPTAANMTYDTSSSTALAPMNPIEPVALVRVVLCTIHMAIC
jgi:hypothetical protein